MYPNKKNKTLDSSRCIDMWVPTSIHEETTDSFVCYCLLVDHKMRQLHLFTQRSYLAHEKNIILVFCWLTQNKWYEVSVSERILKKLIYFKWKLSENVFEAHKLLASFILKLSSVCDNAYFGLTWARNIQTEMFA